MAKMHSKQVEFYRERLNEFLKDNEALYTQKELSYIKEQFLGYFFSYDLSMDIMDEVYQSTGVYDIVTHNIYSEFYTILTRYFDINRNLLEVACGRLASFAKIVANQQTNGSVTAIDPDLRIDSNEGITLIKRKFNFNQDLSNIDLIYAIRPCQSIINIIKLANANDIDLCVLLCKCIHFTERQLEKREGYVEYYDWVEYLEEVMKSTLPKNREFIIEQSEINRTPIFITKRLINK